MRKRTSALATVLMMTVAASAAASSPASQADDHRALAIESTKVKVLDRGERPRQRLRYRWEVGQREGFEADLTMSTQMAMGIAPSEETQVPTIRMSGTMEVLEALGGGRWRVRQTIHAAGVPVDGTDEILATQEVDYALAGLAGLETIMVIDDRGRTLESETALPEGLAPEMASSLGGNTASLEQFLLVLPLEPVGEGAVWKTVQQLGSTAGFDVKQTERVTLRRLGEDHARARVVLRQMARDASLVVPETTEVPDDFSMVVDRHLAKGSGARTVWFDKLVAPSRFSLDSDSSITARVGSAIQSFTMVMEVDQRQVPLPLEAVPEVRPLAPLNTPETATTRHEVTDEGIAVSFPARWRVDPTTREAYGWLYPEDLDDDSLYGILAATGSSQRCVVQDRSGWAVQDPAFADLDDLVSWESSALNRNSEVDTVDKRYYQMDSGRVARVDVTWSDGLTDVYYWYHAGDRWLDLNCWSLDPPRDRWLPIAESFEFLDAQEPGSPDSDTTVDPVSDLPPRSLPGTPPEADGLLTYVRAPAQPAGVEPVRRAGRNVLPDQSAAVTFPVGWAVRTLAPDGGDGLAGVLAPADAPYQTPLLRADDPSGQSLCVLADVSVLAMEAGWPSVRHVAAEQRAQLLRQATFFDPRLLFVRLRGGEAALVYSVTADGRAYDSWLMRDAGTETWLHLACWSAEVDPLHRRSIADSIVFGVSEAGTSSQGGGASSVQPKLVEVPADAAHGVTVGGYRAGDLVAVEATGRWCASAFEDDCGGPDGVRDPSGPYPYAQFAYGELLMQVGESPPRSVGLGRTFRITSSGRLRLFFNDCAACSRDNRGAVSATVRTGDPADLQDQSA